MKLYKLSLIAMAMTTLCFVGCKSENEPDPIPESFPKTHLIEEFTGQGCGYCPRGMDEVHAYMDENPNYVLVMHHTYGTDHFTVSGSKTIASAYDVDAAPQACVDRSKTKSVDGNMIIFNPIYMYSVDPDQFEKTTYASVNIENEYNAETRELRVVVTGAICKTESPALKLTVLVKESGMIDSQQDNYNTFEGWQEFRHTNAVRAFLSKAMGNAITVGNQRYTESFVYKMKSTWNPENCMVVAFLTEEDNVVVQASEKPVVAGTKGGADILHGGITPVAVPDYYPEPNETAGPATYSGREAENLTVSNAYYDQFEAYGITRWIIEAYNKSTTATVSGVKSIPFVELYLLTAYSDSPALPIGTFPINATQEAETVIAGFRNDNPQQLGGSIFYFLNRSYFNQGYFYPTAEWLITDGEMIITDEGWTLNGHARNGSEIHLTGAALVDKTQTNAPARIHARVP